MLELTHSPIDGPQLERRLANPAAGACVTFVGWVRDHNEGREVRSLHYEGYEELCLREGERILAEADSRFPLLGIVCVHRLGPMAIGDAAVWVGVASAHRHEAFEANLYIIDQLKLRLPIWKKEFYADGDSGWVACHRCAHGAETHADEPAPAHRH